MALQGAFAEHARAFAASGARARLVRLPADLEGLDALVIPGGESTTLTMLMERMGLFEPVRDAIRGGLPTLGTCAGLIVMAKRISDAAEGQRSLEVMDVAVRRNGYGRQADSFETALRVRDLEGTFPGVFIRSPLVEDAGSAEVLAEHEGHPVALRQGRIVGLCFHPELTADRRLHRQFLKLAAARS